MKFNKSILSTVVTSSLLVTGCVTTVPPSAATVKIVPSAILNSGTSTYTESQYMCRIATENGVKPKPGHLDMFRMDHANVGYADLYGDGNIEVIAGFSDEMMDVSRKLSKEEVDEWYAGNKERSTKDTQYMFFSKDPNFVVPPETKFNLARNIIPSDLNGDGIDDLVFIQTGRDYDFNSAPNWHNDVMISGPNGYSVSKLPGVNAWWHGGSIGDIDGDGDLDIIATPSRQNSVAAYINDGTGNFKFQHVIGRYNHKYYNVTLWDIDKDGILDIIGSGNDKGPQTAIHWGVGNGKFEQKPFVINKGATLDELSQDSVFADINGDGVEEIISLVSIDSKGGVGAWHGYRVIATEMNGREIKRRIVIDDVPQKSEWFAYITACDLKNDGDMDLIIERWGEQSLSLRNRPTRNTDKIVYENNANSSITRIQLTHTDVYENISASQIEEIINEAIRLGVSYKGFIPTQVYYPTVDGKRKGKNVTDRPLRSVVKESPVYVN